MPVLDYCYRCGSPASTREHFPPKSFFPRGGNLQLRTVPSCKVHNNDKSGDDQYLLAHITMHAASQQNLASSIFMRSVAPQLERSKGFWKSLVQESQQLSGGARAYTVDSKRFDRFFDDLAYAIYFHRFGTILGTKTHRISHEYLSLVTKDPDGLARRKFLRDMLDRFYADSQSLVASYEADRIDEVVYQNKIIDPAGRNGSITIGQTFYGVFEVVTMLSINWPASGGPSRSIDQPGPLPGSA